MTFRPVAYESSQRRLSAVTIDHEQSILAHEAARLGSSVRANSADCSGLPACGTSAGETDSCSGITVDLELNLRSRSTGACTPLGSAGDEGDNPESQGAYWNVKRV